MHYQIFLPGVSVTSPKALIDFGLESLCNPNPRMFNGSIPMTDQPGVICSWGNAPDNLDPEWEWVACGDWWFGTNPADPPNPFDLKLGKVWPGVDVTLNGGFDWHVPFYRRVEHSFQVDSDGEIFRGPVAEFAPFVERCEEMMQEIFSSLDLLDYARGDGERPAESEELKHVTITDGYLLAVDAVALNYRLNRQIATLLNLFGDLEVLRVLTNIIELPKILEERDQEAFKKKQDFDVVANVEQRF